MMDANGKTALHCPMEHDQPAILDSRGDHAITCKSSKAVRIRGHNELRDLCIRAGKEAGLQGRSEPPTGSLLGDAFTDAQLAVRWPGKPTVGSIVHFEKVRVALKTLMEAPPAQRLQAQQTVQALLDSAPSGHGLRLDGELIAPDGSNLWFDVTMIHPTASGRREDQLKWHMERAEKESIAMAEGLVLSDAKDQSMSFAMAKAVKDKHDKYDPVVYTATLQRYIRGGSRQPVPLFKAAALSHIGEMSTGMFDLVEWITGHRKRAARKGGSMYDGRIPNRVAADFRRDLKDAIQVTAARTIGRYIAATGLCY
jgi:hypothetical protein